MTTKSQSVNSSSNPRRRHQPKKDNHQGSLLPCYRRRHHYHYSTTLVFLLLLSTSLISTDIINYYITPILTTTTPSHHKYPLPIIVEAFVPTTTTTTTSFVTPPLTRLKRRYRDTFTPSSSLSSSPNIIPSPSTTTPTNKLIDTTSHHHDGKDDDTTTISLLRTIDDIIQSSSLLNSTSITTIESQIISTIDREHYHDATSHPLASENRHDDDNDDFQHRSQSLSDVVVVPYEIVSLDDGTVIIPGNNDDDDDDPRNDRPFVVRTTDAILDATSATHLRHAATSYWNNNHDDENAPTNRDGNNNDESATTTTTTTSRFTYQRVGNSEVHVGDLNPRSLSIVNDALRSKIYPLVRRAFPRLVGERRGRLSVYDALIVRYNATAAVGGAAGQPLHRDLGVVSVNIALDDVDERGFSTSFRGGGTFFERQMMASLEEEEEGNDARRSSPRLRPLTPMGMGHAIAHSSSERHAGAATMEGMRHILVIFITERYDDDDDDDVGLGVPPRELAARLKQTAGNISRNTVTDDDDERTRWGMMRILYHRLAVMWVPNDGEAWHYLGMALHEQQQQRRQQQPPSSSTAAATDAALSCLERAARLTPCDSRVSNNLGIILSSTIGTTDHPSLRQRQQQHRRRRRRYCHERAVALNALAEDSGCDVGIDANAARLNLGLCYADEDDFERAASVLSLVGRRRGMTREEEERWREDGIIEDARRLREWCERQLLGGR